MSSIITSLSGSNLGGDATSRVSFRKMLIAAHFFDDGQESLTDAIKRGLRASPAVQLNNMQRWSKYPNQAGFVGRCYETVDCDIASYTKNGFTTAYKTDRHPIVLSDDLEWRFLDEYFRVKVSNFTWTNPATAKQDYIATRYAANSTQFYFFLGPAIYTYWSVYRRNQQSNGSPEEQSQAWYTSYNPTTNEITNVSPGNWTDTFTPPGYIPTEQYLYIFSNWDTLLGKRILLPYRVGSNTEPILDLIIAELNGKAKVDTGTYPSLPVRLNNTSVDTSCPELAAQAKEGFKRGTGSKFSKIVEQITSHPQVNDIDLAIVTPGVQANTTTKFGKRYIFEYMSGLARRAQHPVTNRPAYDAAVKKMYDSIKDYLAWEDGGSVGPAPTVYSGIYTNPISTRVCSDAVYPGTWAASGEYWVCFARVRENAGLGLKEPGRTVGSLWWTISGNEATLNWQYSAREWRAIDMDGGAFVLNIPSFPVTKLTESINNPDTPFTFPLHRPSMKGVGPMSAAESANEGLVLIAGSYTVITSSILSGIIFFITAVLIVAFPPSAAGAGLLGTNAAVGAALGLAGSAAVLVGAIVNALAAIVLMKVIQKGAVLVLGDKLGAIIGAIAGIIAVGVGTGLSNGMSMSQVWNQMTSAKSLLSMTAAVGDGIAGAIQASILEMQVEMEYYIKAADEDFRKIQEAYAENIGSGIGTFDPMKLTNSPFGKTGESPSLFFSRTLLTGSDIAEISMGMISEFTNATLTPVLPTST